MTPLFLLLSVKIVVTLVLVVLPMLLLPKERLEALTQTQTKNTSLFRLYGFALLALLVAYTHGIMQVWSSVYPASVLVMGLVSNGGAAFILLKNKEQRHQLYAGLFFVAVTALLIICLIHPEFAMRPLSFRAY